MPSLWMHVVRRMIHKRTSRKRVELWLSERGYTQRHVGDGTVTEKVVDADADINHAFVMREQASNAFPGKSRKPLEKRKQFCSNV